MTATVCKYRCSGPGGVLVATRPVFAPPSLLARIRRCLRELNDDQEFALVYGVYKLCLKVVVVDVHASGLGFPKLVVNKDLTSGGFHYL